MLSLGGHAWPSGVFLLRRSRKMLFVQHAQQGRRCRSRRLVRGTSWRWDVTLLSHELFLEASKEPERAEPAKWEWQETLHLILATGHFLFCSDILSPMSLRISLGEIKLGHEGHLPWELVILLLVVLPREMKVYLHKDLHSNLFIIAKSWSNPNVHPKSWTHNELVVHPHNGTLLSY
jgi:hypothetical protein